VQNQTALARAASIVRSFGGAEPAQRARGHCHQLLLAQQPAILANLRHRQMNWRCLYTKPQSPVKHNGYQTHDERIDTQRRFLDVDQTGNYSAVASHAPKHGTIPSSHHPTISIGA